MFRYRGGDDLMVRRTIISVCTPILALMTFLIAWPGILAFVAEIPACSSANGAAWMQAAAAAVTILVTSGFGLYELRARRRAEGKEKAMNYSIACDVFSDTAKELNRIFGQTRYEAEVLKNPSLLFKANCDIMQEIAFKPFPDQEHATIAFALRNAMFEMLSGITALENIPRSEPSKEKVRDALKSAKKLIGDPKFRRSERTPTIVLPAS